MKERKKPLSFSLCPLNIAYVLEQVAERQKENSRYSVSQYGDDLITHLRTKAKPVKKAKTELAIVNYPMALNVYAWELWIEFRKTAKFKKYKSDAPMNKLIKMGNGDEQLLIVQQSIDNEYQGLFELKSSQKQSTTKNAVDLDDRSWADEFKIRVKK